MDLLAFFVGYSVVVSVMLAAEKLRHRQTRIHLFNSHAITAKDEDKLLAQMQSGAYRDVD